MVEKMQQQEANPAAADKNKPAQPKASASTAGTTQDKSAHDKEMKEAIRVAQEIERMEEEEMMRRAIEES